MNNENRPTHPHLEGLTALVEHFHTKASATRCGDAFCDGAAHGMETCADELAQALAALPGVGVDEASPDEQVMTLAERIGFLKVEHGGLRRAAEKLGIDPGYLSRLYHGEKDSPSDDVLRKLKLVRRIGYAAIPTPNPHEADRNG